MCKNKRHLIKTYFPKELKIYDYFGKRKYFCYIDECLLEEIKHLWDLGIETNGCCCGHGKVDGYIGVNPDGDNIGKMEKLGYDHLTNCLYPEYHFSIKNNKGAL